MLGAGIARLRLRKKVEGVALSSIGSISPGTVKLRGRVVQVDEALESPLEGTVCVHYSFAIREKRWAMRRSTKGRRHTLKRNQHILRKGARSVPFALEDETGRILIHPDGADVRIEQDHTSDSGFLDDPSERIVNFLKREGLSHDGFLGINRKLLFEEQQIAVGEEVFVFGDAAIAPEAGAAPFSVAGRSSSLFIISNRAPELTHANDLVGAYLRLASGLFLTITGYVVATAL